MTADVVFQAIEAGRARPWTTDKEVRTGWISALETATNLILPCDYAQQSASYNGVIIEVTGPGLFEGSKTSARFVEASEARLLPCIQRIAQRENVETEDCIGITIDGDHVCFAQASDRRIETQHLMPFSVHAVKLVIQAIMAQTRKPISAGKLRGRPLPFTDDDLTTIRTFAGGLAEFAEEFRVLWEAQLAAKTREVDKALEGLAARAPKP
jgi:hypothetical protein